MERTSTSDRDDQAILLGQLVERSPDLVAAVDRDFRLITCNSAFQDALLRHLDARVEAGCDLRAALTRGAHGAEPRTDGPEPRTDGAKARYPLVEMWKRALTGEEFTAVARMGRECSGDNLYEFTFRTLPQGVGGGGGAFHTARRVEESAVAGRIERARLETVLEALPVGVWIADADGRFVYRNRAGAEIWGENAPMSERREDYGEDYRAWRSDGKRVDADEWGLARALARGESTVGEELEIETYTGERKVILNSALPIRNERDEVVGGVAVNVDITERKRVEAEQRRANARLTFLLKAANALLAAEKPRTLLRDLFSDLSEQIGVDVYFNYVVRERDGREQLKLDSSGGVPANVVEPFERVEFGSTVCGTVAREKRKMVLENVQERADPMTKTIRSLGVTAYVCHPLVAQQDLVGTLSFGLRERSTFDQDDLDLLQAVADQVASAIQQARSHRAERRARRAAEEANLAKSAFMATISHELRTPLNAVIGYTELLKEGIPTPLNPTNRTSVERIGYGARHLLQLIEEILTFSRLEAGRERVEDERIFTEELLNEVRAVAEPLASGKGLRFSIIREDPPRVIETDPRKLRQILLNLLGNAVKFTEEGEVRLTVRKDGESVLFIISDTGVGIRSEDLERLFDQFWQADTQAVEANGGTGLGLAICSRFADLLDGEIHVESTVGEGSTFALELPLRSGPSS